MRGSMSHAGIREGGRRGDGREVEGGGEGGGGEGKGGGLGGGAGTYSHESRTVCMRRVSHCYCITPTNCVIRCTRSRYLRVVVFRRGRGRWWVLLFGGGGGGGGCCSEEEGAKVVGWRGDYGEEKKGELIVNMFFLSELHRAIVKQEVLWRVD